MDWTNPLVLKINKPENVSSYDVIRKLKKILPKTVKKIGYFGTLDPFAEGLLLVALNQANRLTPYVHEKLSKTYVATGLLGVETKTQDLTTEITQKDTTDYFRDVISKFDMEFCLGQWKSLMGTYWQAPPAYSAAKFQGKKLCQWAREDGIEIKKSPVQREILSMKINKLNFPEITFEVEGSSGTYIRTLFVDMANKLGTIGTLSKLKRIKIGTIDCPSSVDLNDLEQLSDKFVNIAELLPFPMHHLSESHLDDFLHGRKWEIESNEVGPYWVLNEEKVLGLAFHDGTVSNVKIGFH